LGGNYALQASNTARITPLTDGNVFASIFDKQTQFMSNIPADLKYTKDHEWLKVAEDGTATVGITDYAQQSLGDITFVELPSVEEDFGEGDTFGVVESVKAASDLFMPLAGKVLDVNEELENEPEAVNSDPYEKGWILKIQLANPDDINSLLDAEAYKGICD